MCYPDDVHEDEVPAKPYTAEMAQDEEILANLIAATQPAAGVRRKIATGRGWGAWAYNKDIMDEQVGPACAVGVGLLYRGVTIKTDPISEFAVLYGVSEEYAEGVSSGFEGFSDYSGAADQSFTPDYLRGYAVGKAVADALLDG